MRFLLLLALLLPAGRAGMAQDAPPISMPVSEASLYVGQNGRIFPEFNIPGSFTIRWSTDRPDIVRVFPDGTMTGLAAGEAAVILRAGDHEAVVHLTVMPPPADRIVLGVPVDTLVAGTSVPIAFRGVAGPDVPSAPVSPLFDSTDPAVLRVDGSGRVYAEGPGRAQIWAVDGGASGTIELTVVPDPGYAYDIALTTDRVRTGDVVRLRVDALLAGVRVHVPLYPAWFVDRTGAEVTTEDGTGVFVAYEPGIYHISALVGPDRTVAVPVVVEERSDTAELELVGRGPVANHNSADMWVFEGVDGRDYAYIGTYAYDWMKVWDVTDPSSPVLTDSLQVDARRINDVKIHPNGRIGIITREGASSRRNGIVLLDLSDPAHPAILSEYTDTVTGGVHNVWILPGEELVYAVHNGTRDVHIIDISDPAAPVEVGRWGLDQENKSLHDVIVQDGYAFVSYWDDGLVILDAGAGTHGGTARKPVFVSRIAYPEGNTHTAWYDGRYVFVGDEIFPSEWRPDAPIHARGYIHVIDVADMEHPHEVARYEVPEAGAHNIWVEDGRLYVGYYQGGLRVVDITGELRGDLYRQGREIAVFRTTDDDAYVPNWPMTFSAQIHKGLIYSADFNSGLWITRLVEDSPTP